MNNNKSTQKDSLLIIVELEKKYRVNTKRNINEVRIVK